MKGGYRDVEVSLNKVATANITASVVSAGTTVEVNEQAVAIDTTTPTISTTFDAKQAAESPLATLACDRGSGVLNLSLLDAGVASSGGIGAGSGPSVGGQRPRNNNFTVEGVDNNSLSVTGPLITIPNDAVDSFTVLQNQYSAEFGHSSGGQFNQTIKSGTNQFHGTAYEYFQNRNLNAEDSQVALDPGAGTRTATRVTTTTASAATSADRSSRTSCSSSPTGSTTRLASGNSVHRLRADCGRLFAVGRAVPQQHQPAAAPEVRSCWWHQLRRLRLRPCRWLRASRASVTPRNFRRPGPSNSDRRRRLHRPQLPEHAEHRELLRLQHLGEGPVAWPSGYGPRYSAFDTAAQLPTFWVTLPQRYWLITLSEYHNFTPNMNNEFRFGFNRYSQTTRWATRSFPGLGTFPNLVVY